jgi:hypothetical protein
LGACLASQSQAEPSADVLKRLVQAHGGVYSAFNTPSLITHVIANNLCAAKLAATVTQTVVRPGWIVDSIAKGERLPIFEYVLGQKLDAHPRVLKTFGNMPSKAPVVPAVLENSHDDDNDVDDNFAQSDFEENEVDISDAPHRLHFGHIKTHDPGFIAQYYSRSRLHLLSELRWLFR